MGYYLTVLSNGFSFKVYMGVDLKFSGSGDGMHNLGIAHLMFVAGSVGASEISQFFMLVTSFLLLRIKA